MSKNYSDELPSVSVVVTSCRRFDLLRKTLSSFIENNDYPIDKILIVEDSDDLGVFKLQDVLCSVPHEIIFNNGNIGQVASIDKAYRCVRSKYIFHMEDDWVFRRSGIIRKSIQILEHEPSAILVSVREESDMPSYIRSLKMQSLADFGYKRIFPQLHHVWGSFTFNPGLRRTGDYERLSGGYSSIGDERAISLFYKKQGRDMIWLMDGGVAHIGDLMSTYGGGAGYGKERMRGYRRIFSRANWSKWMNSLGRKFWHVLRRLGIDTEILQRRL